MITQKVRLLVNVTSVTSVIIDDSGTSFPLSNLTVFQTGSKNKLECLKLFASHIAFNNNIDQRLQPSWYATKITNNICRLMKAVNNTKNPIDHETNITYKEFGNSAAVA
jgi:hypothetical protein